MHTLCAAEALYTHAQRNAAMFFADEELSDDWADGSTERVQGHALEIHSDPNLQWFTGREAEPSASIDWEEQDIVLLHWGLLGELRQLTSPDTPLAEKIDTLDWVLEGPDDTPFSFANCVRVVGTSPLSPTAYFGLASVEDLRSCIRVNARSWLRQTIERYPHWVQQGIRDQPHWVARRLDDNPQWINEQIKARALQAQPELF